MLNMHRHHLHTGVVPLWWVPKSLCGCSLVPTPHAVCLVFCCVVFFVWLPLLTAPLLTSVSGLHAQRARAPQSLAKCVPPLERSNPVPSRACR
jgi:hypothetical protein